MIIWPGLRRSVSAIQRLFNSASFYAPLTHSLVPERGTGSPTFTRASTATVTNNDGYLVTALAGEARFEGARRVRNLLTFTEDFSNAVWDKHQCTAPVNVVVGPTGRVTNTLTADANGGQHAVRQNVTVISGNTIIWSVYVKAGTASWVRLQCVSLANANCFFNISSGAVGTAVGCTGTIEDAGGGWYRCSIKGTTSATSGFNQVELADGDNDVNSVVSSGLTAYIGGAQLEDVTAQTTQTAGEYVSVGVPSDWQGTELVTNGTFDTDTTWIKEAGWTIGGGVATHAAGVSATLYQGFNFVAGTTYVFSWDTVISAGAVSLRVGGAYLVPIDFKSASGTYTATYTAVTTATDLLGFVCDAPFAGTIDNFSVKPAYYHGSFVDGVKCFPTDINGVPLTTMLGYLVEGARTNLCLQSNAFTTTWTTGGTISVTQNAVGPDGATSAWTLTDNAAGATESIYQGITLTAAAYTGSVFVAKTEGVQSSYPVIFFYPADGTQVQAATVDTTNGVITDWTSADASTMASGRSVRIVSYNDDFWRVELTKTGTAATHYFQLIPAGTTAPTYAGPTVSAAAQGSAVFYGAQVELGSSASSYIATTTIAVTRNVDVESVSTSGNIAAAAGSIYLEYTPTHTPSGTIALWGTYVDASNYTAILHDATNLIFRKRIAGVNYDATIANAFVAGTTYKACATWGAAGTSITLNGTEGTPHANTTAAQIAATMQVGADGNSLQQPGAGTTNLRIWQRQLSSPEGVAVTS